MTHDFVLAPQPPLPFPAAVAFSDEALRRSRGPWPGVVEHRDVAFGPDAWQRFDVFAPTHASDLDVVVFLHGGGWTNGYKEWGGFMAPAITQAGAILVAPTYRLAPDFRYPVFLEDCFAALAAVRARIGALGGNPNRLFIAGHSAGGHLAALLALRTDLWPQYALAGGSIRGCLPVSAILDLHHAAPPPGSLEERVYDTVLANPAQDREASPINRLDRLSVPMTLSWGERDTERVRRSNEQASATLVAGTQPFTSRCYPGLDHFEMQLALGDPAHDWHAQLSAMRRRA